MAATFRFAPSPNGFLHLGHALSAGLNFAAAQRSGGRFLLRIEDIDTIRCRPAYEAAIYQDLGWLGLTWEQPVMRQSARLAAYRAALGRLDAMGLLYPSFESRAELAGLVAARDRSGLWPRDPDGAPLYPGNARGLAAAERGDRIARGDPFALRLDMAAALARLEAPLTYVETGGGAHGDGAGDPGAGPAEGRTVVADPAAWGDVVLARKETPTSYHLAVVVDDAAQSVTDVVRGDDLSAATSIHRLLQTLLGLPAPVYHHHRLVRDASGRKLAKSNHATALRDLRAAGATPADIRRLIGLGLDPVAAGA